MTDALAIIEQTEPRVLPAARAFVLTTLDDVGRQERRDWFLPAYVSAGGVLDLRDQRDWRVEVWPNGRGDL